MNLKLDICFSGVLDDPCERVIQPPKGVWPIGWEPLPRRLYPPSSTFPFLYCLSTKLFHYLVLGTMVLMAKSWARQPQTESSNTVSPNKSFFLYAICSSILVTA